MTNYANNKQDSGVSLEYQQRLSINFIDFVKAFDSVHRESLWSILRVYGVPNKFVDLFRDLYQGSICCIRTNDGMTDFFSVKTGVRQGCILSPFLFLIALDFVMR
uniref:Reverse transcriptase domain-containing protein n=1 Tax=Plectus sambesii TaxID=2011161 RepID=A0A914X4B9_9BILA